jgi:hypothetical protein
MGLRTHVDSLAREKFQPLCNKVRMYSAIFSVSILISVDLKDGTYFRAPEFEKFKGPRRSLAW